MSAVGAPSRDFWMTMGFPNAGLSFAFALGVRRASAGRTRLTIATVLLVRFALNALIWGWAVLRLQFHDVTERPSTTLSPGWMIIVSPGLRPPRTSA